MDNDTWLVGYCSKCMKEIWSNQDWHIIQGDWVNALEHQKNCWRVK